MFFRQSTRATIRWLRSVDLRASFAKFVHSDIMRRQYGHVSM